MLGEVLGPAVQRRPVLWSNRAMASTTHAVESVPTDDQRDPDRVLDLDNVEPTTVPGATAIFAPTYVRTADGAALRYDGDVPTHVVGVYSETDARNALSEVYSTEAVRRAFERGRRMEREHRANANEAVAYAESREDR